MPRKPKDVWNRLSEQTQTQILDEMSEIMVTPSHLTRKAIIYIRQSHPNGAISNQESLQLQYALKQRAINLGWHEDDIQIIDSVAKGIKEHAPDAFCIVLTNPLDAMVYCFHKVTGFPKNQVIGMAGTLDTARYRAFLAMELGYSVADISGTVLGGHGPTMVPLPRLTTIGGVPLTEIATQEQIDAVVTRTRKAGTEIVQLFGKGSAFFSPAWSAIVIAESYLKDKRRVLPGAALCEGEYGVNGLFIGVPCVISAKGVEKILEIKLTDEENGMLQTTLEAVQKTVDECKAQGF